MSYSRSAFSHRRSGCKIEDGAPSCPVKAPMTGQQTQHRVVASIGLSSGAARVCFSTGPKLSLAPASVPLSIEDTEIK